MSDKPDRQAEPGPRTAGPVGPATGSQPGEELFLSVAAVARRLGVAPATLRTWDRRYGLGPAEHAPGTHRRYGPADMARLEVMQQALLRGAAPAEAARHALATRLQDEPPAPSLQADAGSSAGSAPAEPVWMAAGTDVVSLVPSVRPVRVGGRSLRLPGADARTRGLAHAAASLDASAVRQLLDDSLAAVGVIATWDLVVRPVLGAIANCWADSGCGVEIEHLLTEAALGAFGSALRVSPSPQVRRPVLLACVPDELHSLPLYPLAAALGGRGIRCQVLGAALPADALTAAVRRTAPSAVFLWAQLAGYAVPALLAGLPRIRPRVRIFAGGPGWSGVSLPATAELVESLGAATDHIARVVGAGGRRGLAMTRGNQFRG